MGLDSMTVEQRKDESVLPIKFGSYLSLSRVMAFFAFILAEVLVRFVWLN